MTKRFSRSKKYIHTIAPEKKNCKAFTPEKLKLFEHYGVERQIKAAFGKP